jgi:hypothetical protein
MADPGRVVGYFSSAVHAEAATNAFNRQTFNKTRLERLLCRRTGATCSLMVLQTSKNVSQKTSQGPAECKEAVKGFFIGNAAEPYAQESSKETFMTALRHQIRPQNPRGVTNNAYLRSH